MSGDVVERVRMALAEVGEPPEMARLGADGVVELRVDLDVEKGWRALELADANKPTCWACKQWAYAFYVRHRFNHPDAERACLADRRLMDDCGVERPA